MRPYNFRFDTLYFELVERIKHYLYVSLMSGDKNNIKQTNTKKRSHLTVFTI